MLKNHLRAERDTRALKKLLTEDEIDALGSVVHKPQFVLGRLRALMHASRKAGVGDKARSPPAAARRPPPRSPPPPHVSEAPRAPPSSASSGERVAAQVHVVARRVPGRV